ncbi:MAG: hypothetical protein M4D80_25205 [Myxococcota bacterium]|nr:hypothetical protein [Myxococcota bacterium]
MGRALAVALLVACGGGRADDKAPELATYLNDLTGRAEAERRAAVDDWLLSNDEWDRTVALPYRSLYEDYRHELGKARDALVAQLERKHPIVTRAHFAGDTAATHSQSITRWALPTLAPARLAELAGRPATAIDAVFVDVRGKWKAIVGVGPIVRRRVAGLDHTCAAVIDHITPAGGRCIEAAWAVADAALREDRPRFAHACGLARDLCGKPAP